MALMDHTLESALNDFERLAALEKTDLLDTPPEEAFDRLTRLASKVIGAPVSLVSLVDDKRQFFKSSVGLDEPWATSQEMPLSYSFCKNAVHSRADLIVEDAREHPLVKDLRSVDELGLIAYAGIPLIDDDGQALGSFCVIDTKPRVWTDREIEILRELAALVMTEIQLRLRVVGLQEIDRMRSELIAVMSHDLRNPLTTILGSANLLIRRAEQLTEAQSTSLLEAIRDQGYRMLQMTEDLLARSKADTEEGQMRRIPVDIAAVLKRVAASFKLSGRSNPIDVDTPESAVIEGDEGMVEQILTNLVDNACKYSAPESPVTIRLRDEGSAYRVEVSDRGIGIPEGVVSTIFEPFQQVNESRDIADGVGLGLHIVSKFVGLHGGEVEVSSRVDEGSTFTVRLPKDL